MDPDYVYDTANQYSTTRYNMVYVCMNVCV